MFAFRAVSSPRLQHNMKKVRKTLVQNKKLRNKMIHFTIFLYKKTFPIV